MSNCIEETLKRSRVLWGHRHNIIRAITFASMSLTFTGCTTDQSSSPEFIAQLEKALPHQSGPIVISGPGNWFPNTAGYTDGITAPITSPLFMVITPSELALEQWDVGAGKFAIVKIIKTSELAEASVDTFGFGARLVLKLTDGSHDTFEFTRAAGQAVDASKARASATYLSR